MGRKLVSPAGGARIRRLRMALRTTLRWVLWGCCLAVVLLGARSASAAAPMCDEKGASAIAPPPVLPIRDVKIDAGAPLGCEAPPFVHSPVGPRAQGHSVVSDASFDDAWIRPGPGLTPKPSFVRACGPLAISLPPSAGYRRGVFRPPRI
jgi:hypothetical protein